MAILSVLDYIYIHCSRDLKLVGCSADFNHPLSSRTIVSLKRFWLFRIFLSILGLWAPYCKLWSGVDLYKSGNRPPGWLFQSVGFINPYTYTLYIITPRGHIHHCGSVTSVYLPNLAIPNFHFYPHHLCFWSPALVKFLSNFHSPLWFLIG